MTGIDRAEGALTGVAVGTLLGFAPIGCRRAEIPHRWPNGVTEIEAPSGCPDDDDLAQSIVVAEAAAEGPLSVDDLGRRLWFWAEANGAGMGGLTHDALALQGGDDPQRLADRMAAGDVREARGLPVAEASKQAWAGSRAGNGALMRSAPLAVRWHADTKRLVRESIVSAVPTHWDPRCGWSCAIVNLAHRGSFEKPDPDGGAVDRPRRRGRRAQRFRNSSATTTKRNRRRASSRGCIYRSLPGSTTWRSMAADMGFTLLGMQAALISYWQASNFEDGTPADRRSRGRHGHERRDRRCGARRPVRPFGDSTEVATQDVRNPDGSRSHGALRRRLDAGVNA